MKLQVSLLVLRKGVVVKDCFVNSKNREVERCLDFYFRDRLVGSISLEP